jgi:hypothetical protein
MAKNTHFGEWFLYSKNSDKYWKIVTFLWCRLHILEMNKPGTPYCMPTPSMM